MRSPIPVALAVVWRWLWPWPMVPWASQPRRYARRRWPTSIIRSPSTGKRLDLDPSASRCRSRTSGSEPVLLSLPAWTPGSYELDNYARNVQNFAARARARAGGEALRWDKVDYDTWRVRPLGAGEVTVSFDYRADSLDTGNSWATADFAYFNGTNLFLYPEGRGLAFDSRVSIRTEPGWRVATGMTPGAGPNEYVAADFHEVVDMPTFIGRFRRGQRRHRRSAGIVSPPIRKAWSPAMRGRRSGSSCAG